MSVSQNIMFAGSHQQKKIQQNSIYFTAKKLYIHMSFLQDFELEIIYLLTDLNLYILKISIYQRRKNKLNIKCIPVCM